MAPPSAAPAGPTATYGRGATCINSLKPGAWARSWDYRGEHGAPTRERTLGSLAPFVDERNEHTRTARGPQRLHARISAKAAGRRQSAGGRSMPRPALPVLQLAAPPAPSRARAPATLPPGVFGSHFLMPCASLFDATGAPRGEARLTSAVGAMRRARFGEKVEDARVAGPLARVALAGHGSRWPLLGPAQMHVLPRRRTGALCQGSGAGPQSKHLAGFPSPGPAPPPKEPRGRLLAGAAPSFRGNQAVVELAAKGKYRAAALPHPLRPGATAPGRPQARPAGSHSTPTHLVPENGCPGKPNRPQPPATPHSAFAQPTSSCGPLLTLFSER